MKTVLQLVFVALLLLVFIPQVSSVTTLSRGVNIGDWLNDDESYMVQTTKYSKADFEDIKSLGCDHVRIWVNFNTMDNIAPEYQISPVYYQCLDKAIGWAKEVGLKVIITADKYTITNGTFTDLITPISTSWKNVASRYDSENVDDVLYEIQGHPGNSIYSANWNTLANATISAIREADTKHTIVVGPVFDYSLDSLASLQKFSDDNILYAFEFHDPVNFSQQGETFMEIFYNTVVLPFPYNAGLMPTMDAADAGSAAEEMYNNYAALGTVNYVQQRIDLAAQFAAQHSVSVYCSSLGAAAGTHWNWDKSASWYIPAKYRGAWLEAARSYMESKTIPWCVTNYRGNFSIFDELSTDPNTWLKFSNFDYDVNDTLATALGLTPPPAAVYEAETLTDGFVVYDEEITGLSRVGWWLGDGWPDFMVTDNPATGNYCLGIFYPGQWNAVDFFFPLYLDLSTLADEGYLLDFFIRCDDPTGHIEARFEDTNDDFEEHPWRMNFHIDDSVVPFDGDWQRFNMPLSEMQDQGSWDEDDQGWYGGGEGLQDWSRVQRLQFVSETAAQPETEIYLDRIRIVSPTGIKDKESQQPVDAFRLEANYPNPFNPSTTIEFALENRDIVKLSVYNINGELVKTIANGTLNAGVHQVAWDGTNLQNHPVPSGIYFYKLETEKQSLVRRMLLIK